MTEIEKTKALDLLGDHGERFIPWEDLDSVSHEQLDELRARMDAALRETPGLQINESVDVARGGYLIRWRTRL